MINFKKFLLTVVLFICTSSIFISYAQNSATVNWKASYKDLGKNIYELVFTGNIQDGYHTYDTKNEYSATTFTFEKGDFELVGSPYELSKGEDHYGDIVYYKQIVIAQKVKLNKSNAQIKGMITWRACTEQNCLTPEDWDFNIEIKSSKVASPTKEKTQEANVDAKKDTAVSNSAELKPTQQVDKQSTDSKKQGITKDQNKEEGTPIWALIIEAILWGFAMILTPCVFPMIPMTISFFMKGSSSPRAGRFKAIMYGVFIILLYTLPISLIIGITWVLGGDAVTADIFNWLATHWIPNIIFFVIFIIFAASFFGAFEITLPSSLVNKSDKNADKKGLAGIFFMALTLVLVSFSCTGPIVGSVLIKSTQGEFWAPMVTMFAFSVAFALPFTIFALFPSLLTKLKSGSWMNSVKVVLGFIEVALAFKFLSIPDQTYHWGLLDREVYLAIWIVVFSLLGLYLLGKIRFAHDSVVEKLSVFRLSLVILVFSFVVYMIPGMFGAPLKALSGYLPPYETQDFIVLNNASQINVSTNNQEAKKQKYDLKMPLGLNGYFTIEEGLAEAKKTGKPVFIDMTGHGCTNCREMEARVWSDPKVLEMLRNDFIIVALYTDDKTELSKEDWITTPSGKVIKDMGRKNSYIVRERFGVNAQPNYTILSPDGEQLVPIRGYNLNVDEFVKYLQSGLDANKSK